MDRLCSRQSRICFFFFLIFGTQEQVTSNRIVRACQNSNSSEILCLSRLGCNFHNDSIKTKDKLEYEIFGTTGQVAQTWPEFEIIRDVMSV